MGDERETLTWHCHGGFHDHAHLWPEFRTIMRMIMKDHRKAERIF